jgi:hypothetical protein
MAVGGVLEMVEFGGNGLLITAAAPEEMGRTLLNLLAQPERLAEMGRAGRRRAETLYDLRGGVAQTAALFRSLAGRHDDGRLNDVRPLARPIKPEAAPAGVRNAGNGNTRSRPSLGDQT